MIVYGLKTCDTCRKALKALPDAGFVDVRADGLPDDVRDRALGRSGMRWSTPAPPPGGACPRRTAPPRPRRFWPRMLR